MAYQDTNAGRLAQQGSNGGRVILTFDLVKERLVETVRLWWRMPGGGGWPFAGDGPWHLIRKEWEDWDARDPKPLRQLPLRRDEVAAMEEATEWLLLIPEADRRVVVLGLVYLAKGEKRVPWNRMKGVLGIERGAGGLRMRFERGLSVAVLRLNGMSETQALAVGRRNPGRWCVNPDGEPASK